MRGAMPAETGVPAMMAGHVHDVLREHGLEDEPVGIDITDMPTMVALQARGLRLGDGAPVMQSARRIKTQDEIALLDHAAAIVDAVYDVIYRTLRPGIRE